jgi:hypothetical protein
MSYSSGYSSGYLQARANACRGYADEGACLARVARFAPVTIMPGFSGLGQADSLASLAARSAELVALQTALMSAGVLSIRTADGVISSASSPTLAAIRTWATSHGLSSTGTARTASGGLAIPASLLARITGGAGTTGGSSSETSVSKTGSATESAEPSGGGGRSSVATWMPWAGAGMYLLGGGAALFLLGAVLLSRRGAR